MSQRLAFMKLHNALREGTGGGRDAWRKGLEDLGFKDTLLEDSTDPPLHGGRMSSQFVGALEELSRPPEPLVPARRRPFDDVAPIERLDLLIRLARDLKDGGLSNRVVSREELAIRAVARSLLERGARDDANVTMLLAAIDKVSKGNKQVIRIPDLEGAEHPQLMTRPQVPRAARGSSRTVQDLLASPVSSRLVTGLADHPIVVVDTCIYKAMVGGEAEYPVHLRTTISYEGSGRVVANFQHVLEPEKWPTFNPFWLGMSKTPPAKGAFPVPLTPEAKEATSRANPYIAHVGKIGWKSVGTFHELVGFDGPNAGGPQAANGVGANGEELGLFKQTYLYFSRAKSSPAQEILTYTLLRRVAALRVDDGCIEIKQTDKGVDVITTKSLYVSGVGLNTELAGILAYLAAYSGWGTNTLVLVSNAVK
jgi:hypothetical protein